MKHVEPAVGKEIRNSSPLEHLLIVVVSVCHILPSVVISVYPCAPCMEYVTYSYCRFKPNVGKDSIH